MNNFHIYEEVGRGKDSVVYKGRKKKTVEYVAVKSVEKFRRKKVLNEVSQAKKVLIRCLIVSIYRYESSII